VEEEEEEVTATAVDATQDHPLAEPLQKQMDPEVEAVSVDGQAGIAKHGQGADDAMDEAEEVAANQVEAVAVVENQEDSVKAELCTDGSIDADAAAEAIAANKVESAEVETAAVVANEEETVKHGPGAEGFVAEAAVDEVSPSSQLPPAAAATMDSVAAVEASATAPVLADNADAAYDRLIEAIKEGAIGDALLLADGVQSSNFPAVLAEKVGSSDAVLQAVRCPASDEDKRRMLQALVGKLGMDPDRPNPESLNRTPIFFAAHTGASRALAYLLEQKAVVDRTDEGKQIALHYAAARGHLSCIQELIANKSDPGQRDTREQTPLFWAVSRGHLECTRFLLEANYAAGVVPAAALDHHGRTPLFYVGDLKIAALLLDRKCPPDVSDHANRQTALFFAARKGHHAIIDVLVRKGATVDARDHNGETPLHYAVVGARDPPAAGQPADDRPKLAARASQTLLKAKANPGQQSGTTACTPLQSALTKSNYSDEKFKALIAVFEPLRGPRLLDLQSQSPVKSDAQGRIARLGSVVSQGMRTRGRAGSEVSLGRPAPSQVSSAMHSQVRRQTRQMTASNTTPPAKRPAASGEQGLWHGKRSRCSIAFFKEEEGAIRPLSGDRFEKQLNDLADAVPWLRLNDLQRELPWISTAQP